MWHSTAIVERIDSRTIRTANSIYKLDGPMDQQAWDAAGLSRSITEAFANGFPEEWQSLLASVPLAEDAAASRRRQGKRRPQDSPTATPPRPQRARVATDFGGGGDDGDEGGGGKGGAKAPELVVTTAISPLPWAAPGGLPWGGWYRTTRGAAGQYFSAAGPSSLAAAVAARGVHQRGGEVESAWLRPARRCVATAPWQECGEELAEREQRKAEVCQRESLANGCRRSSP